FLRMIHAENERSFDTALRGMAYPLTKQLASRQLIQAHEVLRMRADEQIVFTAGNAPLRCGRAIWFRRSDMKACVRENRFQEQEASADDPVSPEPN
ncbi:type IV secretory system conjugative DNA transfer family protein, partial [Rhizobium sp. Rhizsp42]|uniref:type IV secretory system conjugative DNA transfer family protein n=1 Tax=Rhizobium sp. Rhizsp42 TaxID=3243034 RepID=UPI0039AFB5C0